MTTCDKWGTRKCAGPLVTYACDVPGCDWTATRCAVHGSSPARSIARHKIDAHGDGGPRAAKRNVSRLVREYLATHAPATQATIGDALLHDDPVGRRHVGSTLAGLLVSGSAHRVDGVWFPGPAPQEQRAVGFQRERPTPPMKRCKVCGGLVWLRDLEDHAECLHPALRAGLAVAELYEPRRQEMP